MFTVAVVAGQTASGLLMDRAGPVPAGPQAVNLRRPTGAVLALVAVALAVANQLGAPRTLWLGLGAVAGQLVERCCSMRSCRR